MALQIGDAVPDCAFFRLDGGLVRLSELATRPVVLIFLRHLA